MNVQQNMKKCKKCGAQIPFKAQKCQFCGKGQDTDTGLIAIGVILISFFILAMLLQFVSNDNSENIVNDENRVKQETANNNTAEEIIKEEKEEQTEVLMEDLSEAEYKERCNEMFYNDIFFSKENFEGEYVKLNLFFSEKYFFTIDDMHTDSTQRFYKENNLYRDFYKCCVLRKDTDSYVGQQIDVFFTQDYELNPSNYKTGQEVIMYGKVVHCSTNTWSGYNQVYFIPKYIDKK